jgi:hypothetical protein
MLPNFLLSETVVRQDGTGPEIDIFKDAGRTLLLTFGITRVIEQESVDLMLDGSADGTTWGDRPVAVFPQKFYCGTYTMFVDLGGRTDVRFLRVRWKLNRWGRGEPTPLFGIYVFAQEANSVLRTAVA